MNSKQQYVELSDGHFIPALGYGTFKPQEPGEELLPTDENGKLIHDSVDLCAVWEAMEKCKDAGLAKSIGLSNFNRRQLEMILNKPGLRYKPVCNQVPNSKITEVTQIAIEAGYRHIDCAYVYQVEEEVGLAIRSKIADGTVKRDDIFYTSKLWSTFHRPELVQLSLKRSLQKLNLDYVDLYLIHLPVAMKPGEEFYPKDENGKLIYDSVDLCDVWEAMEKCKDAGLAKSIGVSNFNCRQLNIILNKPGLKYKPVCNQVECHVYHNQKKLLDFCKSKDIVLVAHSALGTQREKSTDLNSPVLLEDPVLGALAKKHKRSPALIALRYQLQRGIVVLAQSLKENEIKENIQVFNFQLTDEDMIELDGLNRNFRYLLIKSMANHPNYPFADE